MKVLLLGATGYLGSTVGKHLATAGHEVVAVVRSDPARIGTKFETRAGDLRSPQMLRTVVGPDIDAVVHAAAPIGDWDADLRAMQALVAPLQGSGKPFVYLSGIWILGPTPDADENSPVAPIPKAAGRPALEAAVRIDGIRGIVVRPGIVYGKGAGIPRGMVMRARRDGVCRYVVGAAGDVVADTEPPRWPMVHVDDVGSLVSLALEKAEPGAVLHAIGEPGVPVDAVARAADRAAGGTGATKPWPVAEAAAELGAAYAQALATSQVIRATRAAALGWHPGHTDAVGWIETDSYS